MYKSMHFVSCAYRLGDLMNNPFGSGTLCTGYAGHQQKCSEGVSN